ncbi:MAG: ATP-binding protein [Patescibacteria group bacterium]|jgi:two-component system phosphate regulon sensor histidine kinase PhoR|nr:ATP-binding protein [Patescibacteria group bacterium]
MALKTIKSKIIVNISLIVFLGGLLTAIAIGWLSYNKEIGFVKEKLLLKNNLSSETINLYFEDSTSLAKSLSTNDIIVKIIEDDVYENPELFLNFSNDKLNLETIDIIVSETLKTYRLKEDYEDIIVTDNFGEIYLSGYPEKIHQNISHTPYFKKSINGYGAVNAIYKKEEDKTFYYISQPIKNSNNQIIGTIIIEMRPENVNTLLNSNLEEKQRGFLVDENGIIVSSSDLKNLYTSFGKLNPSIQSTINEEQRFVSKTIASFNYQEIQNIITRGVSKTFNKTVTKGTNEIVFTISPVGNTGFSNILQTNLSQHRVDALKRAGTAFLPTILTIIVIIIFLYFIISSLLKPIDKLKLTAVAIGKGLFNLEKRIKTGDELEALENVMLNTSEKLKEAHLEMEDKIKARTLEIEKKKMQAEKANQAILNIMEDIEKEKNNVEELNKNLKKFKTALDNTSEQVLIADIEGIILYANKGMGYLSGYDREEVIGKSTDKLWRIIEDKAKEKQMWKTILEEKKSYTGEFKCKHKDGHEYFIHKTITPILDDDNNVSFIISIAYDKTKEKEIDRAKTEFVSLASHQLRTPLSSINWYAEMLLDGDAGKLTKDQKSFVEEISKGNKRMVDLVNSLLDVSRLELGTFSIEPEIMQVYDSAKSVIKELKPEINKKKLKLNFECKEDIPKINADPKLVRIIFQNLLSNAVKYTPEKGKINLNVSKNKKFIIVTVEDSGMGIPRSQQDKLFNKLFRADNAKSSDTEGTGLGLYLVKSILDSSGGIIDFKSEENVGTKFTVKIPVSGMKKKEGTKKLGE